MKKSSFLLISTDVAAHSRLKTSIKYIQHGNTSVLLHSIAVAYYCNCFSNKFRFIPFHDEDMIRGALLHDYFLYDWHIPDKTRPLHGFYHPKAACRNAESEFNLTDIERDIIKKHMFPLTITPPKYKESVLVCLVDKVCSTYETFKKNPYHNKQIKDVYKSILSA